MHEILSSVSSKTAVVLILKVVTSYYLNVIYYKRYNRLNITAYIICFKKVDNNELIIFSGIAQILNIKGTNKYEVLAFIKLEKHFIR
jgi:hypothetical protein